MRGILPPVTDLLPHTGRAILVDELVEEHPEGVTARVRIRRDHPFFDAALGGVPVWVGIELMAQTIALHAGMVGQRQGRPPHVGYLLGVRRYSPADGVFAEDDDLAIHVQKLYEDESGLGSYDCLILQDEAMLVQATLSVFQTGEARQP